MPDLSVPLHVSHGGERWMDSPVFSPEVNGDVIWDSLHFRFVSTNKTQKWEFKDTFLMSLERELN